MENIKTPLEIKKEELMRRIGILKNNGLPVENNESQKEKIENNYKNIISTAEISHIGGEIKSEGNISQENEAEKLDKNTVQKKQYYIDRIILDIRVKLSKEEREIGFHSENRRFNIPIDYSIELLFNLLIGEQKDFCIKFSSDATIDCRYHQLENNETESLSGDNRGKIEINLHQDNRVEQDILPSKTKVFELILGDYEVNYHLNNFYNYIKGQERLLAKESLYYENRILDEVQKAKKRLELSHKLNTSEITKLLNEINSKDKSSERISQKEKEMKQRWKDRYANGIHDLSLGKEGKRIIRKINYTSNALEIELLADILNIGINPLRRLIQRLEKKTNKKYLFYNDLSLNLSDGKNNKVTDKKSLNHYNREKGFVTYMGFFEIIAYRKAYKDTLK